MRICSLSFTTVAVSANSVQDSLNILWTRLTNINSTVSVHDDIQQELSVWEHDLNVALRAKPGERSLRPILARANDLNLKALVSVFSPSAGNNIGKYACYCSAHEEMMDDYTWFGRGMPLDDADSLCRQLWWGYKCLKKDMASCDASQPYNWIVNPDSDQKVLCLDNENTCEGELCRLDVQFAKELSQMDHWWDPNYFVKNGFNRFDACVGQIATNRPPMAMLMNDQGADFSSPTASPSQCCGKKLSRRLYKPDKFECCRDGSVARIGQC